MHKHFASGPHMSMNISSVSKFGKTPLTHLCNAWTLPKVIKKEIENDRKDYFENIFHDTEDSYNAWWTVWNREEPCIHSYNTQQINPPEMISKPARMAIIFNELSINKVKKMTAKSRTGKVCK